MPMITLTLRKSNPDRMELRYTPTDDQNTLKTLNLNTLRGLWVSVKEIIKFGDNGSYFIEIRKINDNSLLFNYSNNSIDMWQDGADFARPKWGIYRSLNNQQDLRDVSKNLNKSIEIMLHIAQPENGIWWFKEAKENGVTDFDWIGLSYYPNWSQYTIQDVSPVLKSLIETYNKKLMIVETAYPFSLLDVDAANNILGTDALISGYEATQAGQLKYLLDLKQTIKSAGGSGLIY